MIAIGPRIALLSLSAVYFVASISNAAETGTLFGRVTDTAGIPIHGASVVLPDQHQGASTDSTGFYRIQDVPVGRSTLRALAAGFERDERAIQVSAGMMTAVDFKLQPKPDYVPRNRGNPDYVRAVAAPIYNGTYFPCDDADRSEPERESLVQIGVEFVKGNDADEYRYNVKNRSGDTLTEIRIGFDTARYVCQLTGAGSHVVPDTALGPPGWACTPVIQADDPIAFALAWKARYGVGIPPRSSLSGFKILVRERDALYSETHWLAGAGTRSYWVVGSTEPTTIYGGRLRPKHEVDAISMATGEVSGRVMDQGGKALSGEIVMVMNGGMSAVSAPDGSYRISSVPEGVHALVTDPSHYKPCGKKAVRVTSGKTTRADFHLSTGKIQIPCSLYKTSRDRVERPFLSDGEIAYRGLRSDTTSRAFVATVDREFRNPVEERLLRIAEETYPPTKAVASVADDREYAKHLLRENRLWWYGEIDGVRLPYAVTGDAARYYFELTKTLGKGSPPHPHGITMERSEFSYSATISNGPTKFPWEGGVFTDVYVVVLKLSWSNYCGTECACGFSLDRTVLIRPDGTLVCVFGDRKPRVVVS